MIQTTPRRRGTQAAAESRAAPRRLDDSIRTQIAALAGLAWVVLLPIALAAQPAPDPAEPPSPLGDTISLVFTAMLFGSMVGLTMRRRWGVLATLGGGATMMVAASLCYLTGHTGAWIAIQFVAGAALAASGRLLDRVG